MSTLQQEAPVKRISLADILSMPDILGGGGWVFSCKMSEDLTNTMAKLSILIEKFDNDLVNKRLSLAVYETVESCAINGLNQLIKHSPFSLVLTYYSASGDKKSTQTFYGCKVAKCSMSVSNSECKATKVYVKISYASLVVAK